MQEFIDWEAVWNRANSEFKLGEHSVHGPRHWLNVEANGLALCAQTGAIENVVRLFAYLHDCQRIDDGFDSDHGRRAARFARQIHGELFRLSEAHFKLLETAIELHADGQVSNNATIGTCWDADRLDLGRVGIKPRAKMLSTEAAKTWL
jgi:uncharacterized protein